MYDIKIATHVTDWTCNGPVVHWTFEFGFANKEEYLEQTAGWKEEYKKLSQEIRNHKLWRKPRFRPEGLSGWQVDVKLGGLRTKARQMCQMRVQAKAQARRQMMAAKQAA